MKPITKAIIGVAGSGTRRHPITKVIEKCMLPLLNKPVVEYVVEDCVAAGITEICFVVNSGATQIQDYFDERADHYEGVQFFCMEQPDDGRYGSSLPLMLAKEFIGDADRFVFMGGDDTAYNIDGSSELQRLFDGLAHAHQSVGMMATTVDESQVNSFGCIELTEGGSYKSIVEKPAPEEAPSNLINISKYVLHKDIFEYVARQESRGLSGDTKEYQLIDILNEYTAEGGDIMVHTILGRYLDAGTTSRWVAANQYLLDHQG